MRLLERYIYSEKALKTKIINKFPHCDEDAKKVIEELKRLGFIDDEKNVLYFIDLLAARGYGERYIKRYLSKKGFPIPERIELATDAAIEKWVLKKTKGVSKLERKGLQKLFFYLRSKGFSSDEIFDFLRKRGFYEGE